MKLIIILLCFLSLKANAQGIEMNHENFISWDSAIKLHPIPKEGVLSGSQGLKIEVVQPDTAFIPPNIHFIKIDGKVFEIRRNIELVEVQPHINFNQWLHGAKPDQNNYYILPDLLKIVDSTTLNIPLIYQVPEPKGKIILARKN